MVQIILRNLCYPQFAKCGKIALCVFEKYKSLTGYFFFKGPKTCYFPTLSFFFILRKISRFSIFLHFWLTHLQIFQKYTSKKSFNMRIKIIHWVTALWCHFELRNFNSFMFIRGVPQSGGRPLNIRWDHGYQLRSKFAIFITL